MQKAATNEAAPERKARSVTEGLIDDQALCDEFDVSPKTTARWRRMGLPVEIKFGRQIFYDPVKVRRFLSRGEPEPARRRTRP